MYRKEQKEHFNMLNVKPKLNWALIFAIILIILAFILWIVVGKMGKKPSGV
jgi:hypothetical protein